MIDCIRGVEEEKEEENDRSTPKKNITLEEVLVPMKQLVRHVVIVMDALKDFSLKPLQWALHHLISDHSTITLLGVMPWTPLALSCKTWPDVWTYEFGDLSALKGTTTAKTNNKHHKIREVIELCDQKGVVPSIKVAMGHPLRLVVLEQTTTLHASFVVLDRHQRKNRTFFAKRLPSSVVMMKNDGEIDMLRIQSAIDSCDITPQQSPATFISTQVILSHDLSHLYSKDKYQS